MSDNINKSVLSLKSLLSPAKSTEIDYPGFPGFKVNVTFLSREELVKIRKKSTTTSMKKGMPVETLNDALFLQLYTQGCVKGWTGLKLSYLEQLAPVNLEGQDLEATLAFDDDNALFLMKQSNDFDAFISDVVTDLSNFNGSNGKK
jgi:hypothetical protein